MSEARVMVSRRTFASVDRRGPAGAPWIVIVPPLGMPGAVLEPFRARLALRLRVLTAELPGTGAASGIEAGATTRDLAEALVAVLDEVGVRTAHLFGISLGGMIAQWAAIDAPERIARLVLASTTGRGLDAALRSSVPKLAIARALVGGAPLGARLAREIVSEHVRGDARAMARIARAIEAHPRETEEVAWLAAAALRHDARTVLGEIRAQTLVLSGAEDVIVPSRVQAELARAIPGATRATVSCAGHDLTLDQPRATAEIVERFVLGGEVLAGEVPGARGRAPCPARRPYW